MPVIINEQFLSAKQELIAENSTVWFFLAYEWNKK